MESRVEKAAVREGSGFSRGQARADTCFGDKGMRLCKKRKRERRRRAAAPARLPFQPRIPARGNLLRPRLCLRQQCDNIPKRGNVSIHIQILAVGGTGAAVSQTSPYSAHAFAAREFPRSRSLMHRNASRRPAPARSRPKGTQTGVPRRS